MSDSAPSVGEKLRRRPSDNASSSSSSSSIIAARSTGQQPAGLEDIRTHVSRRPSRPFDAKLERAQTALSYVRSRRPIPPFSHVLSHKPTDVDVIVTFDGEDDPYKPRNWTTRQKVVTTALYGLTTAGSTFASSVYSAGIRQVAEDFHVGTEVSSLGISLLLFGFGTGPLLWAPLSEVYGRKTAVLIPYFISACFAVATATAENIQTVCITRFFAGFFGSAPVTNTGGVLNDLFAPDTRGLAMVGYAMAVVGGPIIGPISEYPNAPKCGRKLIHFSSWWCSCPDTIPWVALDRISDIDTHDDHISLGHHLHR